MRDMTIDELAPLGAVAGEADEAFHMTEEAFRLLYERTSRSLWAYLSRMTGDCRLADDLLQETYFRFLKSTTTFEDEAHRRNYLFRIATNLVLDARRRPRLDEDRSMDASDDPTLATAGDLAADAARRLDVSRAMAKLRPRDRALVWLAYVNGSSHKEIAETLGLKSASIKLLLFRARRRLAALLREGSR
jgi:RNA polymerase sigma-70 factor, ECF subfamily